jgi:hypothetical protein
MGIRWECIEAKAIPFYLLLLVGHMAHVFEEIWGRFWLIDAVYGLGWFLVVNWILFLIPVAIFYDVLRGRRWAYSLGILSGRILPLGVIPRTVQALARLLPTAHFTVTGGASCSGARRGPSCGPVWHRLGQ